MNQTILAARPVSAMLRFLRGETVGGVLLIAAAALGMILANSESADDYFHVVHLVVGPELTPKLGPMTVHLWINDGLMALFFLLVGLEIKREWLDGRLSTWSQRRLPIIAAAAGMAVPALIYVALAGGDPQTMRGWAVPAATDIAFAMGVLALLGPRVPSSLKLFLVTVAIVDDMGAVAIIALFYTAKINIAALGAAAVIWLAMLALGRMHVRNLALYLAAFAILWYAVLLSGIHATIAGVLAAFAVPIVATPGAPDAAHSPLHRLENALHPWTSYLIIPLFGLANAGVSLAGMTPQHLLDPVPLGIAAGLFAGKQLGIFSAIWLAVKAGIAGKLRGATWLQIWGVAVLCGIGFTMSLFIAGLAFADRVLGEEAKIGILIGSMMSAVLGYIVLRLAPLHPLHLASEAEAAAEIDLDGDTYDMEERDPAGAGLIERRPD